MDYQLADALNDLSGHNWLADDVMVFAARDLIFVLFVAAGLALLPVARRRDWAALVRVAATLGVAFCLGVAAAHVYAEPRPFSAHADIHRLVTHAPGQSFPSDHATAAFAVALAVLFFVSQRWGWWLVAGAAVVGVARVYVGVHYPGDIAGSLAVALLAVSLVRLASVIAGRRGSHGSHGSRGTATGPQSA